MSSHRRIARAALVIKAVLLGSALLGAAAGITLVSLFSPKE